MDDETGRQPWYGGSHWTAHFKETKFVAHSGEIWEQRSDRSIYSKQQLNGLDRPMPKQRNLLGASNKTECENATSVCKL